MGNRRALVAVWAGMLMWALIACGGKSPSSPATPAPQLNVTIANGQITLHVTSDVTDELHVHSVPDHKFQVAAAPNQTFQFSVDVPGSVDVESHHLHKTIATIQVQP